MSGQKRVNKSLTIEDKIAAIERVKNGETQAAVCRNLTINELMLRNWIRSEDRLRNYVRDNNDVRVEKISFSDAIKCGEGLIWHLEEIGGEYIDILRIQAIIDKTKILEIRSQKQTPITSFFLKPVPPTTAAINEDTATINEDTATIPV